MSLKLDIEMLEPRKEIALPASGACKGELRFPPLYPEWLGDSAFAGAHGTRFNYVVGEMARGIATPAMVVAAVNCGCMGFYGSAGLGLDEVRAGVRKIAGELSRDQTAWGANLIRW